MVDSPVQTLLLFETLLLMGCLIVIGRWMTQRSQPSSPVRIIQPTQDVATPQDVTDLKSEIETLRQEGLKLRDELAHQHHAVTAEVQLETFRQLQTLLTNYPSVGQMIQVKPELPAKNITSLFTPLNNLLQQWGYEQIGPAWAQVAFDPQLHQPDQADIQRGDPVYIRFVGYRQGETILCPAKVSRTLPGGTA